MAFKFVFISALVLVGLQEILGHGYMRVPINRSSGWRDGFKTPINYNDNENFCGGFGIQYGENGGKCGPCGDDYRDPQPRNNENGGMYNKDEKATTYYTSGQRTTVVVNVTSSHFGYFEFAVCPLKSASDIETEECFAAHPVKLANGLDSYSPVATRDVYSIDVVLPAGLTCERCTFRWHYNAGNSWGTCADGTGAMGCGNQEQFRSCADIVIR